MFPTWYRQLSPAAKRVYTSGGRFESLPAAEVLDPSFDGYEWFHRNITVKDQKAWWAPAVSGEGRDIQRMKANSPAILCCSSPTDSEAVTAALALAVKWTLFGMIVQVVDLADHRDVSMVMRDDADVEAVVIHNLTDDSTPDRVEAARDVLRRGSGRFLRVLACGGLPQAVGQRLRYKEFAAVFNLYTGFTDDGAVRRIGKVQHR